MHKVLCVGFVMVISFLSCNKSSNNSSTDAGTPVTASYPAEFSNTLMDTAGIDYVIPLGNLNPIGGHIYPSDHIYFALKKLGNTVPQVPVYAAGYGTIIRINNYLDGAVYIAFNNNQVYYYDHINLDNSLKTGSVVKAGDKIGVTSGMAAALDLGFYNTTNSSLPRLLNTERYQPSTKYCVDPLTIYSAGWQNYFYAKSLTQKNKKGGKVDFDLSGTIKGNWFDESLTIQQTLAGTSAWPFQIAFVPDNIDTTKQRISIGGSPGGNGNNLTLPGLFAVKSDTPFFENVNLSSGLVKYTLYDPSDIGFTKPLGLLLVQCVDNQKIKVETFTNLTANAFTGAAKNYVR